MLTVGRLATGGLPCGGRTPAGGSSSSSWHGRVPHAPAPVLASCVSTSYACGAAFKSPPCGVACPAGCGQRVQRLRSNGRRAHHRIVLVGCRSDTGAEAHSQEHSEVPRDSATQQSASDAQFVKIPLVGHDQASRRSKLIIFTCNKCGGRSQKNANPIAVEKGLVFGQCEHCGAWHVLANNNPKLLEEVRYTHEKTDHDGSVV